MVHITYLLDYNQYVGIEPQIAPLHQIQEQPLIGSNTEIQNQKWGDSWELVSVLGDYIRVPNKDSSSLKKKLAIQPGDLHG